MVFIFIFRDIEYKLFLDFREVYDTTGVYEKLYHWLQGRGVPSISDAIKAHTLIPVHKAFDELFSENIFEEVNSFCFQNKKSAKKPKLIDNTIAKVEALIDEINYIENVPLSKDEVIKELKNDLSSVKYFVENWDQALQDSKTKKSIEKIKESLTILNSNSAQNRQVLSILNHYQKFRK